MTPPPASGITSYSQHRRRQLAYGRWNPWVDATPIRDHIRTQMAAGLGWERLARTARVNDNVVSRLLYGRTGHPPTQRMRPHHAARLLAVTVNPTTLAPNALTDATGTRRRIQGLNWLGYSDHHISTLIRGPRTGMIVRDLHRATRVTHETARALRDVTDRYENTKPPTTTKGQRISVTKTRNHAHRHGYVPLAAWDHIDDPASSPLKTVIRREVAA